MNVTDILTAALLGIVEGLTEFIPVSSTAHLLLAGQLFGFESTGKVFEVLIQLGAIVAIAAIYRRRLYDVTKRAMAGDQQAMVFVFGVFVAFLPAAVLGVLLHGVIKTIFFETPVLICTMLISGGVALLWIERLPRSVVHRDSMTLSPRLCLQIGLFQCLALVPGVSRSGATIAGALLLGVEKRAAAEFSFFLAMPTMLGAFVYDLFKSRHLLDTADTLLIVTGFFTALIAAGVVVRWVLDFISRYGFAPFAWWRIAVGGTGLVAIAVSS